MTRLTRDTACGSVARALLSSWGSRVLEHSAVADDVHSYRALQSGDDPIVGLTERERRFAEAYFDVVLETGTEAGAAQIAYRRAFPLSLADDKPVATAARQLINSKRVRELVARLKEKLSERALVPATRVIEEIERMAFTNMLDFMTVDSSGNATIDLRNLTPRQASAILELTTEETYDPKTERTTTRTKIKLHPKSTALDQLARVHGLYQDRLNISYSLEDLDRAIAAMEAKLASGPVIEHQPMGAQS